MGGGARFLPQLSEVSFSCSIVSLAPEFQNNNFADHLKIRSPNATWPR